MYGVFFFIHCIGKSEKIFFKKESFLHFAIDKSRNMVYNIKLHYNRLICLKMGRDCFGSAMYILILYEKIILPQNPANFEWM